VPVVLEIVESSLFNLGKFDDKSLDFP